MLDIPVPVPIDLQSESCTLASLMLCGDDRALFRRIRLAVGSANVFHSPENAAVFRVLCEMDDRDRAIDAVLLRGELAQRGILEQVGGVPWLAKVLNIVPTCQHGEHYARRVVGRWRERQAILAAHSLMEAIGQGGTDDAAESAIDACVAKLATVKASSESVTTWQIGEEMDRVGTAMSQPHAVTFINSGYDAIDANFKIFFPSGYTILAARPSMGKSTLLKNIFDRMSGKGVRCGLISDEESREKIAQNYLSLATNIGNARMFSGKLEPEEWVRVAKAAADYSERPIWGTDNAYTLNAVLAAIELMVARHGCHVVGIDHIHLISGGAGENRTNQLTNISAAIKAAARRLKISIVAAAQLKRIEGRSTNRPSLADLRDSGSLEEHADVVAFLHREDYYHRHEQNYHADFKAELIVAKNRNGPPGVVILQTHLSTMRFDDFNEVEPF